MKEKKPPTVSEFVAAFIKPKVTGQGVVIKKDGTVSKPVEEKK